MPVNSQAQAVLDKYAELGPLPVENLSPENARNNPTLKNAVEQMAADSALVRTMNVAMPVMPEPVGKIDHITIPTQDGELIARIFTPDGNAPFPVVVYFHGGGFVIANLDVYEASCRALCNAAECIVVSVAYRLAPENKFPAQIDDAYAATQWIIQNAAQIGGDSSRVAVCGESAGGNLAAVTCLRARDEGGQMPVAQILVYPLVDSSMNTPSYTENANAKPLNAAMMTWFFKHYLSGSEDKTNPYIAPLQATDLSGLPPAVVITAESDPLRDEGEMYAKRLAEAGVSVDSKCFDGTMHEFFGLGGAIDEGKEAVTLAADALKKVFERQAKSSAT